MKIYWKLAIVVTLAIVATFGLSTFQLSQWITDVQLTERSARQATQMSLVKLTLEAQIEKSVTELFSVTNAEYRINNKSEELEASRKISPIRSKQALQSQYLGVFLASKSKIQKNWTTQWGRVSQSIFDSASQNYWNKFSQKFPWERVRGNNTTWVRFEGPKKEPLLAMLVKVSMHQEKGTDSAVHTSVDDGGVGTDSLGQVVDAAREKTEQVLVGIVPARYFDRLGWWAKDSNSRMYIIDTQGYALSHPQQSYVGARLSENRTVLKILKNQDLEGSLRSDHGEKTVEAKYSKVPQTNLYALLEDQVASPVSFRDILKGEALVHIFSVLLLAIVLLFWFVQPVVRNFQLLKEAVLSFLSGHAMRWPEQASKETQSLIKSLMLKVENDCDFSSANHLTEEEQLQVELERKSAITDEVEKNTEKLKKGLAQSLIGPLATIIGQCQLFSNSLDKESKDNLQHILSEARAARNIVEGLTRSLANTKEEEPQSFKVVEAVTMATDAHRLELIAKQVLLTSDVPSNVKLYTRKKQYVEMVKDVIAMAIDRVSNDLEPKIEIQVREINDKVNFMLSHPQDQKEEVHLVENSVHFLVIQSLAKSIQADVSTGLNAAGEATISVITPRIDSYPVAAVAAIDNDWDGEIALKLPHLHDEGAGLEIEEVTLKTPSKMILEEPGGFNQKSNQSQPQSQSDKTLPPLQKRIEAEIEKQQSSLNTEELEMESIITHSMQSMATDRQLIIEESDLLTEEELGEFDEFTMTPLNIVDGAKSSVGRGASLKSSTSPFASKDIDQLEGKSPISSEILLPPHPGTLLEESPEADTISMPIEIKESQKIKIRPPRVVE